MKDLKTAWETDIGKMMGDLSQIVIKDGKVTSDEKQLLQSIRLDINKFVQAYIKALDDKKITQKETDRLLTLWKKIYSQAEETANLDGVITSDERNMLLRVAESVLRQ